MGRQMGSRPFHFLFLLHHGLLHLCALRFRRLGQSRSSLLIDPSRDLIRLAGSFYSYYTDKREVFIAAPKVYYEEFQESLMGSLGAIELNPDMDRIEFMTSFVDSLISAHDVYKELHQELAAMYDSDSEIKQLRDEQERKGRELTQQYLLLWKDKLKAADIEAASVVVFETLNRIVDVMVFSDYDADFSDRIKTELVRMITSYLFDQ